MMQDDSAHWLAACRRAEAEARRVLALYERGATDWQHVLAARSTAKEARRVYDVVSQLIDGRVA